MKVCPHCQEKSISSVQCLVTSKAFPAKCRVCGKGCFTESFQGIIVGSITSTLVVLAAIPLALFFSLWIAIFVFWACFIIERITQLIAPLKKADPTTGPRLCFDPLILFWHLGLALATIWAYFRVSH